MRFTFTQHDVSNDLPVTSRADPTKTETWRHRFLMSTVLRLTQKSEGGKPLSDSSPPPPARAEKVKRKDEDASVTHSHTHTHWNWTVKSVIRVAQDATDDGAVIQAKGCRVADVTSRTHSSRRMKCSNQELTAIGGGGDYNIVKASEKYLWKIIVPPPPKKINLLTPFPRWSRNERFPLIKMEKLTNVSNQWICL